MAGTAATIRIDDGSSCGTIRVVYLVLVDARILVVLREDAPGGIDRQLKASMSQSV